MPRHVVRPLVLAVVAAMTALLLGLPDASAATPAGLSGPDVASYQHPSGGAIDWPAVRNSGQRWAFVKATEGMTYKNPYFTQDWRGSASAGLYHGAYHYARPTTASGNAAAQAHELATTIGPQHVPGTLPPILDLEETGGLSPPALISWTSQFLQALEAETGRVPMIYTYPSFWKNQMAGSTSFFRYPLWIANYGVGSPQQLGWPHWTFWQYTSTGTVDGISSPGATDISVFNGTALDLAALAEAGSWGPASSTASETSSGGPDPSSACPGSRYIPVAPERFVDSRDGRGGVSGPVSGTVTVTLPGSVPADASSVVLDVSAVTPRGPGYLRVAPAGTAPTTTALNYPAGHSVTGLVLTTFDAQHRIDISTYASGTDLAVDLVGYYTPTAGTGGHYVPVDATRVVDTRSGTGGPAGRMTTDLTFRLPGNVPSDAVGVVLDVTAVDPVNDGYLRLAPTGTTATTTAVNFEGGGSTTGLAVTSSNAGQVTVTIAGSSSNLVVDLLGYYEGASSTGSGYVPVSPTRFVDTRRGLAAGGPGAGPLAVTLPSSVPPDATAVLLDVSIVAPDGKGFIRFAAPGTQATTTALNVLKGGSRTGLVVTGQRDGQLTLATYAMKSHLVIDLVGYETPCSPPPSPAPSASPSTSPAPAATAAKRP